MAEIVKRVNTIAPPATTADRSVILHAHMFKNAGSTLDWSLHRSFGANFIDHRDDTAMRESGNYLAGYLDAHPKVEAVSSHWLPIPAPSLPKIKVRPLVLFRNPLERSRSVYNFERSQRSIDPPGNIKAQTLSFKEYVEWRLEPQTGPVIKNFHTRYCSGDYFGQDIERMFVRALKNIDKLSLVGLVHRYAESMILFEAALQGEFPTLDLSWRIQNTSQPTQTSVEERVSCIASELGNTFNALLEANAYDLKLLQYCEQKFDKELNKVTDLDARSHSLSLRNTQLNE